VTETAPGPEAPRRSAAPLIIRWTVGDVCPAGYEALRLSIAEARRLFGDGPRYCVCVNSIDLDEARARAGEVPQDVAWLSVERDVPAVLRPFVDAGMSEETAWKFIRLQLDPAVRKLAVDNDVILWDLPVVLRKWLASETGQDRLMAADVALAQGQLAHLCGPKPRNSGIRGTPAGFDFDAAIAAVLHDCPVTHQSEPDEQGLQIAALSRDAEPLVVSVDQVAICSPFPPHGAEMGSCGAHFVGLNARRFHWDFFGRPAHEVRLDAPAAEEREVVRYSFEGCPLVMDVDQQIMRRSLC